VFRVQGFGLRVFEVGSIGCRVEPVRSEEETP